MHAGKSQRECVAPTRMALRCYLDFISESAQAHESGVQARGSICDNTCTLRVAHAPEIDVQARGSFKQRILKE